MKIGIITDETDTRLVGSGTYTLCLVRSMLKLDKENEYYLVHRKKEEHDIYSMANEVIVPYNPAFPFSTIRNFIQLPLKLRKYDFDIVHHTSSIGPFVFKSLMPARKGRNIESVLDIIPLVRPETFEWQVRKSFRHLLPRIVRNVDHIFTISEKSKSDIISAFRVKPEKIEVVYPGCIEGVFKPIKKSAAKAELEAKYNIADDYILFVSSLEAKKNVPTLLNAYNELKKRGYRQKLVMVGKKGYGYDAIEAMIKQLKLENDVIMPGYVPLEDLPKFYSAAEALVMPSVYEGFGIPVVEANSCGCPVIVSNGGSLPEIAGKSAIIVGVYDAQGYANAIEKIITEKSAREKMVAAGFRNAKRFSWKTAAKKTIGAYRRLI